MAQVYSQNGWPAFHTAGDGGFVRFNAGGRGWWAANADVGTVAKEFIDRFNTEVEPVIEPGEEYDDWSFADRLVRGSTADVSNHGSATAWDINSTRHLLGADNTFSDADEARLRAIVADITDDAGRPVLRWGGSYSGRKDEMHIEINATIKQVRQAADKIRAKATPTPRDWFTMATKDELKAAITDVLSVRLDTPYQVDAANALGGTRKLNEVISAGDLLRYGGLRHQQILAGVRQIIATEGAQTAVLAEILKSGGSLTVEQAQAAATAGADAALAKLAERLGDDG